MITLDKVKSTKSPLTKARQGGAYAAFEIMIQEVKKCDDLPDLLIKLEGYRDFYKRLYENS